MSGNAGEGRGEAHVGERPDRSPGRSAAKQECGASAARTARPSKNIGDELDAAATARVEARVGDVGADVVVVGGRPVYCTEAES